MAGSLKIKELILENADGSSSTSITLGEDGKLNFGNAFSADPLPGSIVQVQYKELTTVVDITSQNLSTITGLSIDFTPKYNNSMILLQSMINSTARYVCTFGFLKNNLVMSPITNTNSNGSISTTYFGSDQGSAVMYNHFIQYTEISGSTTMRTYSAGVSSSWDGTTYTVKINDRGTDMRSVSSLTIFEVKQ